MTGHPPHGFQEEIAGKLLGGTSIVLRAPTGSGKTWAATAPFLYSVAKGTRMADRLLYALPLRSLASGLHATTYAALKSTPGRFPEVTGAGRDRDYRSSALCCSLQIGGEANDPFFESDITFTTIDQLLSAYLMSPVSLPERLGNIGAGAVIGSLLVFDEAHLFEPDTALGTVIEMLDRLRGLCQFVLMTATMSSRATAWLASKLGAEQFCIPEDEVQRLPSHRTKERVWRWTGQVLDAAAVREAHRGGRTIALVNTVGRAQRLFRELEALYGGSPTTLLLLHSRFYPADRKAVEERLDGYLGPRATASDVILVTTQVIEAGIDISADHLLTELAPMNTLVQRAGRAARYPDRNVGTVSVCEVDNPGPYRARAERAAMDAARTLLQSLPGSGRVIHWAEEQEWVERVHGSEEALELARYDSLHLRRSLVHDAMEGERGRLPQLIRDSSSVGVLISEEPENLNFTGRTDSGARIGWPRLLSVPAHSLIGGLGQRMKESAPPPWVVKGAFSPEAASEEAGLVFQWRPLASPGQIAAQWLVAIHPDFARYDSRLGLMLGEGGVAPEVQYTQVAPLPKYHYDFEPWTEHALKTVGAARVMQAAHANGARRLAFGSFFPRQMPDGTLVTASEIERLVEIACALHDAGKLSVEWQNAAWSWQREKDGRLRAAGIVPPERPVTPLAHTTFDPSVDRDAHPLPSHAVEGAYAVQEAAFGQLRSLLGEETGLLATLCVVSAIARHHAPRARRLPMFRLVPGAGAVAGSVLPRRTHDIDLLECQTLRAQNDFGDSLMTLANERHVPGWPLFVFLLRRLRLADQGAVRQGDGTIG